MYLGPLEAMRIGKAITPVFVMEITANKYPSKKKLTNSVIFRDEKFWMYRTYSYIYIYIVYIYAHKTFLTNLYLLCIWTYRISLFIFISVRAPQIFNFKSYKNKKNCFWLIAYNKFILEPNDNPIDIEKEWMLSLCIFSCSYMNLT